MVLSSNRWVVFRISLLHLAVLGAHRKRDRNRLRPPFSSQNCRESHLPTMSLRGLPMIASIVLVSLLAILFQILFNSPISPELLELPPLIRPSGIFAINNVLQGVDKLGEGLLDGPEDVCVDRSTGTIYTATRDGWIRRMVLSDGSSWEDWKMVGGPSLLGLALSKTGDLLVCDAVKGLLKVNEDGVLVLASEEIGGSKIKLADDAIEGSDGSIYFSDASTKFGFGYWFLELLEAKPHGRLLKYNPLTNTTSILLHDLAFANGVALSADEDFLIVCETWKFRCLKHYLKGEERTEVFIENLPAGPDNINLAEDGSFWIALVEIRSTWLDLVHRSKVAKHVLATFPKLGGMIFRPQKGATVVKVSPDGKITEKFDDSTGKTMFFVTSALEYEGHLYLGSLGTKFIGKLPLNRSEEKFE